MYTAGGAGDPEPSKSVGFSNGEGPRVGATSNGQIGFVFNVENGTSTVIDRASVVIQYQDANGYHDCPLNPYVPNPLVQ